MLTRNDLAKKFGVTVVTIDRWRKGGILPSPVLLGSRTVRWREVDINLFDNWLLDQVKAQEAGLDPLQIPKPIYSLPICNDPSALTRELLAAEHDPESELESEVEVLNEKLGGLYAQAAIIASQSAPGQLSAAEIQRLRDNLPDASKEILLRELPEANAARLEEILK